MAPPNDDFVALQKREAVQVLKDATRTIDLIVGAIQTKRLDESKSEVVKRVLKTLSSVDSYCGFLENTRAAHAIDYLHDFISVVKDFHSMIDDCKYVDDIYIKFEEQYDNTSPLIKLDLYIYNNAQNFDQLVENANNIYYTEKQIKNIMKKHSNNN